VAYTGLLRIAILGTRGIPARYGGFETFAEELSTRLIERGHTVTVYCREKEPQGSYRGVHRQYLPTIRHKYFDTLAHTGISTLHLLFHRVDVVLYCNGANAIYTWLPRLLGMPVAINVDGLERNRKKWNELARKWYHLSEWLSTFCPTRIITDASEIERYYLDTYNAPSTFIPYGAELGPIQWQPSLSLGLTPKQYFLSVTRFEPENNPLLVRESFEQVDTPMKLALVGDAPYAQEYIAQIRDTRDKRILIPGAIYGQGYKVLQSHCFAYIHATEVGGTHPALIEAMGRGALILYLKTPENCEVAGGIGIEFEYDTLPQAIAQSLAMPESEREALREAALQRVRERYSWDVVTDQYEALFRELCPGRG
jgi:glycosyltransferase involved in cell wall biosynthesis